MGPIVTFPIQLCLVVAHILNIRPIHSWNFPAKFRWLKRLYSLVKEIVKYWEDDTRKVMIVGPVGQNVLYLVYKLG